MNAAVLVLDIAMQPLRVEPWQKAICDVFLGKVEVVEYSQDRTIQGVTQAWPLPSVVRVLRSIKRDKVRVKFSRLNIYTRDGFKCQFCGSRFMSEELTFDHVVPRSRGGKTVWENIVTCCVACNRLKGDRLLAEVKECQNFTFSTEAIARQFVVDIQEDPATVSTSVLKNKAIVVLDLAQSARIMSKATELNVLSIKAGLELIKQPKKPKYLPLVTVKMDARSRPPEWEPYWSVVLEA